MSAARQYPKMRPIQQERFQERIRDWAAMTPEQRKAARETFQGLRKLPPSKQHELRAALAGAQGHPRARPARPTPGPSSPADAGTRPPGAGPRAPAGLRALRDADPRRAGARGHLSVPRLRRRLHERAAPPPAAGLGRPRRGCLPRGVLDARRADPRHEDVAHPRGSRPTAGRCAPGRPCAATSSPWAGAAALGTGFLWALLDRDGQFLHDRLARHAPASTRGRASAAPRARAPRPPRPGR